ncbi:MAG: nucleoside monophosphate kinase [Puniceicoccales bacterium]|jgi:adenylate kinase|nr:nucleoside monophosphate kinase [Puniceicoccales bacterium]
MIPSKEANNLGTSQALLDAVWPEVEARCVAGHSALPREVFWLNGAPGSGKGTHTSALMQHLGYRSSPVVTSDLLKTQAARALIDAGQLVGDREVSSIVLRALSEPHHREGVVVDGFPRTRIQAEFLRLLHARLVAHRSQCGPPPRFHIFVLFVDEEESVRRQMQRGQETLRTSGGSQAVRKTDLDPELARQRFRVFMEQTIEPLRALRDLFPFHIVNTTGTIEEVRQRIVAQLGCCGK